MVRSSVEALPADLVVRNGRVDVDGAAIVPLHVG